MYRKVVFILSLLVVFSVVAAGRSGACVGADAYTGCGDLHAEINWMAAR